MKKPTGPVAAGCFARSTRLARIDLRKVEPRHLNDRRVDMIAMRAVVNGRAKLKSRRTRTRSAAAVNRDTASMRAASNLR